MRDLLLGRPVRDVDLVVEGDGLAFARKLGERLGAAVTAHPRFGTAALVLPGGGGLDVASARAESYDHPGALPRVRAGNLEEDLARRDFTINAMAIVLWPGPVRLLDPHGGRKDLELRVLRLMHPGSPADDPTRAFRAARYAHRLQFRVEGRSARWIREAAGGGAFDRISGERLRREVEKLLSEAGRAGVLAQMCRLGLTARVHPGLPAGAGARRLLRRVERLASAAAPGARGSWLAYLLVWASELTASQAAELAHRLRLSRGPARALKRWPETRRPAGSRRTDLSADERLAAAALSPGRPEDDLSGDIRVRGRDLVAAGVAPGPAIGRALAATRKARRLGRIGSEEELSFAVGAARGEMS